MSAARKTEIIAGVEAIGMVSTAVVAAMLGKENPRAGRDWCRRHGIALRKDGKNNLAALTDVRRELGGLPVADTTPNPKRQSGDRAERMARLLKQRTG